MPDLALQRQRGANSCLTTSPNASQQARHEPEHGMSLNRKVRYGMVGGGPGAFIGAVHRKAAALDGEIEIVAGAFSSDAAKSKRQGEELVLHPGRVYASWKAMVDAESRLPE